MKMEVVVALSGSGLKMVGIGEMLIDKFEDGQSTLGGAPFNVAFHLHQLVHTLETGKALMVSRVGDDYDGKRLLDLLASCSMDAKYVSVDPKYPTGVAKVFAHAGSAGYEITRDVAWDQIESSPELDELAASASAIVFGSLAQRADPTRRTVRRFVGLVKGERLYDVNLRRNATDGVAGYSEEIITESLKLATVLKLNDEELEEIASMLRLNASGEGDELIRQRMHELQQSYGLKVVIVTRGAKGSLVLSGAELLQLEDSDIPQDTVHPVGAGDSFTAGLLYGLVRGWKLRSCVTLADTLSRWVVTRVSATPEMPADMIQTVKSIAAKAESEVAQ